MKTERRMFDAKGNEVQDAKLAVYIQELKIDDSGKVVEESHYHREMDQANKLD